MVSPPSGRPFRINYEAELNPQQLEVVKAPGGPMLVIAGAGSGKTRTVTYRVAHLIESGVDPSQILLVTFTNKAAREMLQRVETLVPGAVGMSSRVWGGTFHHIGNRILRRHATLMGYQPNYTILDQEDARHLLEDCVSELKIQTRGSQFPKGAVLENLIGFSMNTQQPIDDIVLDRHPYFAEFLDDLRAVADHYRKRKREQNAVDFDDLLCLWKNLLKEHPEVGGRYAEQFRHILVDEYQDTNRIQADIVDLLGTVHHNITAVGDDSQSIYSFRGADFANILSFPDRYPAARVFKLEVNYRSTPEILYLANRSIVHNRHQFPKELQTARPAGPLPALMPPQDTLEQASLVVQKVQEANRRGVPFSQMAVLYRAHYHSMELQMELTRRGIPFEVRSGLRFFEQAHIKDISAYLKITCNPRDETAWKRVLQFYPRIGKATAEKIWRLIAASSDPRTAMDAKEVVQKIPAAFREEWRALGRILAELDRLTGDPAKMIALVMDESYEAYLRSRYPNYESRSDDLRQLASFARGYSSCQEFLSELALLTGIEEDEIPDAGSDGTLKLSTVHQAKGLEWSVVFIIWLAEGRFPSSRSLADLGGAGEEEERRLFYVAVTRARDELYLFYPRFAPDKGGRDMIQRPSRFIAELGGEGYDLIECGETLKDRWRF